jgi:2-methylcitrate dehydratase PrpD
MGFLGLTAALMAQKGYTGDMDILDGDEGYWKMAGSHNSNWEALTGELGKRWLIAETSIKWFPACRNSSHSIDLFRALVEKEKLGPKEIEEVVLRVPFFTTYLRETGYPSNIVDAQFSIPYAIAMVAHRIKRGYRWYLPETLKDHEIVNFFNRVRMEDNRDGLATMVKQVKEKGRYLGLPTSIEVKARGKVYRASCQFTKGDPWTPETNMTDEEVKDKFRDLCHDILPVDSMEKGLVRLFALENMEEVSSIIPYLVAK